MRSGNTIPFDRQSSHPCDMRDSNTPRIHLVFGFQTALQILRSLDRETVDKRRYSRIVSHDADAASVHRTSSALPRGVPSKPDLSRAFDRLCLEHPGLEFDMPAHLLIGSGSRCRSSDRAVAHLCKSAIPRRALCRLDDSVVLASPNLALCQMASCIHDSIALLQLLWEACGTYGTPLAGPVSFAETAYELQPLTSLTSLRAFCSRNSHLNGAAKIARMLKYVAGGSASPRETGLALLLGLPGRYGGYNLGIPIMNHEVKASRKAWEMSGKRSFRLDLCWPEARIDVEYQSSYGHSGEEARIGDSRRANALRSMGWNVVGVTGVEATGLPSIDTIANTVRRSLGKRARPTTLELHERRIRLRRALDLI